MILGEGSRTASTAATLDDSVPARRRAPSRCARARRPAQPRELHRRSAAPLSFAQADRAISALAARLRGLGLQTDTVVAIQLANTVESVIALSRRAARRHDRGADATALAPAGDGGALDHIGAKAIITSVAHWNRRAGRDCDAGRGRAVSDPSRLRLRRQSARRYCVARRCVRRRAAPMSAMTDTATGPGRRPCRGRHL